MRETLRAIRRTLRVVRRDPGSVAVIVLTLGVGIAATTATVNVAVKVLMTTLPVHDESRLVLIKKRLPTGSTPVPFSPNEMAAWAEATATLSALGGVQYDGAVPWTAEIGRTTLPLTGTMVSGNLFSVLGTDPVIGRLLTPSDAVAGAEEVVVISHEFWQRQFDGSPAALGQRIRLNGRVTTITGVVPRGFPFPKGADAWQPLTITAETTNEGWFTLLGRLGPDATFRQASAEADRLLERLRPLSWSTLPNLRTDVVPFKDDVVGDVKPMIRLFVAAAILVFLMGCVNVVSLLLVRGMTRQRELSVCLALGAVPGRLVRQLTTEAAVLALAGGALGCVLAFWLQRTLIGLAPAGVPRIDEVSFDASTLAIVATGSLVSALLAGVLPALWVVRQSASAALGRPGTETGPMRGQSRRQFLVALQLAFALLIVVSAALLLETVRQLQRADLGFAPDRLTVVEVPLVSDRYDDPQRRIELFERLTSSLEALPEVTAATPVLAPPFTGQAGWDAAFTGEGQDANEASANPGVHLEAVLPNYFATLGIRLASGRAFAESDRQGSAPVAIVSESLARHAWPLSDAVGKRIKFGAPDSAVPWMTVVGVAGEMRYRDLDHPPPSIYVPLRQTQFPPRFLLVRASVDQAPVLALTRRALQALDASEPVPAATPVAELRDRELAAPRFQMLVLILYGGTSVLLAGVGVFGVLAAFVAQRAWEVGVRVALGATATDVRRLVLARMVWPTAFGLSAGTLSAFVLAPFLSPLLFNVNAVDGRAMASAWAILSLTSVAAAAVPLRRATRIDPVRMLRGD